MALTSRSDRSRLHLLAAPSAGSGSPPSFSEPPRPRTTQLTRRPGERYELWPVPADVWWRRVSELAEERRLEVSTLAAALVERQLGLERLEAAGLSSLTRGLDECAAAARVADALWSSSAGYLRYLTVGATERHDLGDTVALPARLSDQVRNRWPIQPNPDDADGAIDWEVAAVVEGMTVNEWALHRALIATAGTNT